MNTTKFFALALVAFSSVAFIIGTAQAGDSAYHNGVKYDDVRDDKYTQVDQDQDQIGKRLPSTRDDRHVTKNGTTYDDAYDDKYTEIDAAQDDVAAAGRDAKRGAKSSGREIKHDSKAFWNRATKDNVD